ncbi:MAG: cytochrome c, partial [Cyclobacteriaceae bacterium]
DDDLDKGTVVGGAKIYTVYCGTCHQRDGKGASGRFPPLAGATWVTGDKKLLIGIVLKGMEGPIDVNGEQFNSTMPQHSFLSNEEIANVLTYIRERFGNKASAVTTEEVAAVRKTLGP